MKIWSICNLEILKSKELIIIYRQYLCKPLCSGLVLRGTEVTRSQKKDSSLLQLCWAHSCYGFVHFLCHLGSACHNNIHFIRSHICCSVHPFCITHGGKILVRL